MEVYKIITLLRKMPEPPKEAPGVASVVQQVLNMPMLRPVRLFWNNLLALRSWWPFLLPLMAWIGWRTYRRERAQFLATFPTTAPAASAPSQPMKSSVS